MSIQKVGYVRLHRPGRLTNVVTVFLFVILVAAYITSVQNGVASGWAMLLAVVLSPFVVLTFDFVSRRRVSLLGNLPDGFAAQLKELNPAWLLKQSGKGCKNWRRVELGLPRTIADESLKTKLNAIPVPDGLIEPEQILTSKPGSMFGCVFGVTLSLFMAFAMIYTALFAPFFPVFSWVLAVILLFNVIQLVLGLPVVHRSRKLPEFLRRIGRRRMMSRAFVVGPGWVKFGSKVWRADRDMLLIRRVGYRLASSEIDCMFAGPESRRRLTFSGVGDEEFHLLFGAWNVDEIRLEFIDSEIS